MKASWPPTWTIPSRLIRRRNNSDRGTGFSTITAKAGKRAARYRAATRPDSPSRVSSTILSISMKNLVGNRRHRHRPHAVAVLQGAEMIEDVAQKDQVFLQIGTKIVRVPPQMKEPSATGRYLHCRGDPPQAQALQHGIFPHRSQETTCRNIDHAVDERWLVIVRAADRQIAVGHAASAHKKSLLGLAA